MDRIIYRFHATTATTTTTIGQLLTSSRNQLAGTSSISNYPTSLSRGVVARGVAMVRRKFIKAFGAFTALTS
jgi:hypothetical protein